MRIVVTIAIVLFGTNETSSAVEYTKPMGADFILKNFKFAGGEALAEVRLHYRTIGKIQHDKEGRINNAVLILHGTTGEGSNFINDCFAGELFGKDQPLDAARYFLVIPDNLGHGKSSKPRDGLHAKWTGHSHRSSNSLDSL